MKDLIYPVITILAALAGIGMAELLFRLRRRLCRRVTPQPCAHRAGAIQGEFFDNPPELHLRAHCADCGRPFRLGENESPGLVVKVTYEPKPFVSQTTLTNEQV